MKSALTLATICVGLQLELTGCDRITSPDGPTGNVYTIMFVKDRKLCTIKSDGSALNVTTFNGLWCYGAKRASTGNLIAFVGDSASVPGLYLTSSQGDAPTRIAVLGSPESMVPIMFSWCPDAKKIVYCDSRYQLWVVDVYSRIPVQVAPTFSTLPIWSPDGRYVMDTYIPADSIAPSPYLVQVDGSGMTRLPISSGEFIGEAWTQGNTIVFHGGPIPFTLPGATDDLFLYDLSDSTLTKLSHDGKTAGGELSPDQTRLIVSKVNGNSITYYTMNLKDCSLQTLLVGYKVSGLAWSPDSKEIAFMIPSTSVQYALDLCVISAEGGQPRILATGIESLMLDTYSE